MDPVRINLFKYRGVNSSLYTGRPQGEDARLDCKLNEMDSKGIKVVFIIPIGTSSFNPSFYLGLLFDSIKFYGVDKYEQYYSFEIVDQNPDIIQVLKDNLEDGKRYAINTILNKTGFQRFL